MKYLVIDMGELEQYSIDRKRSLTTLDRSRMGHKRSGKSPKRSTFMFERSTIKPERSRPAPDRSGMPPKRSTTIPVRLKRRLDRSQILKTHS
ncbi:MAG TPA: hypothetical protein VK077_07385 [Virgibacillus sp.]|nr:hypothetical protein [Virgibacillus sp.]